MRRNVGVMLVVLLILEASGCALRRGPILAERRQVLGAQTELQVVEAPAFRAFVLEKPDGLSDSSEAADYYASAAGKVFLGEICEAVLDRILCMLLTDSAYSDQRMGDALVAAARAARSEAWVKALDLGDPIATVTARLTAGIQREYGIPQVRVMPGALNYPGVVLEVRTNYWGVRENRVGYLAQAKLTNLADGKVLWTDSCGTIWSDKTGKVRELYSARGWLLKTKLHEAAGTCADHLLSLLTRGTK